jgi:hypothetical protein
VKSVSNYFERVEGLKFRVCVLGLRAGEGGGYKVSGDEEGGEDQLAAP